MYLYVRLAPPTGRLVVMHTTHIFSEWNALKSLVIQSTGMCLFIASVVRFEILQSYED